MPNYISRGRKMFRISDEPEKAKEQIEKAKGKPDTELEKQYKIEHPNR